MNFHLKFFVILVPLFLRMLLCNKIHGRYTRDIDDYYLTVPHKATSNGEFHTYNIPHFYHHNFESSKKKRSLEDNDVVHYIIEHANKVYHINLWPNHGFISPDAISENREPKRKVQERRLRRLQSKDMCHYTGHIKGKPYDKAALSTCEGLAGYITLQGERYFVEPLAEHEPNKKGQHLHVIYKKDSGSKNKKTCGTSGNWEDIWRGRFYDKFSSTEGLDLPKRGLTSVHRYLETLVVCDKKFLLHHKGKREIETYVLTIMNMVADYYHDSSGGNQMDVVVVRIMYLDKEEEEIDLVINANADDTLASFCKWQQKINPKDLSNPNHHDIAVLLTRYDICTDNLSSCGLMGLAYVASACTDNEPCAINEDSGLALGVVVAHEMGHVMGCSHDKPEESSCPSQDKDGSYFIMSPYVHLFTTRWSTCSRGFITSLFDNDLGECLNDEPQVSLYKDWNMLPGAVYDAEQQCQMEFPDSSVCRMDESKFCELLLCKTSPTDCMSNDEPLADGTSCGANMWCYQKKCIPKGERIQAVNGGWGEWGEFTECSRTCGGGVQIAERNCDNPVPKNKGLYCIGERKKIKTCNTKPCPPGSKSFREVQCEEHNSKPFQDKLYIWKAYFEEAEPCVLYCLNNENTFAKLEPRVKDGTSCKPGTKNMCVSGTCKKVGCDGKIDSSAVEDVCGICNGDGTQCKRIEKIFDGAPGNDYTKIASFPVKARNVKIEELKPSTNTIAVTDATGEHFYLNGNHQEQTDGDYKFGEVEGIYSHPEPRKESLIIQGPLTEELVFHVCFYERENVGYQYSYVEPSTELAYEAKYHWEILDWDECSVKCGGGYQKSIASCVEEKGGRVADSFCKHQEKPEEKTKTCNEHPCKTKWKVGKWGKCHACRYKSGVRVRPVECVMESTNRGAEDTLVEDSECTEVKPGTRQLCNSHHKCKDKRFTDGIPDYLMENVWKHLNKIEGKSGHQHQKFKRNFHCHGKNKTKGHGVKLNVGAIVKDVIPEGQIKLIKVPVKQSHLSLNLSDNAFETMGDKVADSFDTRHAKIATGEKAAEMYKKFQHKKPNEDVH